jgi:hypothetical protein
MSEAGEDGRARAAQRSPCGPASATITPDKRTEIANRVVKFYDDEKMLRDRGRNARLQRYAKYRCGPKARTGRGRTPADAAVPDMLQDSSASAGHAAQRGHVAKAAGHRQRRPWKPTSRKENRRQPAAASGFSASSKGENHRRNGEAFTNDPSCTSLSRGCARRRRWPTSRFSTRSPKTLTRRIFPRPAAAQIKDISRWTRWRMGLGRDARPVTNWTSAFTPTKRTKSKW